MTAEPFRAAAPALTLDNPKHIGKVSSVIPGVCHDLRPKRIGLSLEFATVLEQEDARHYLTRTRNHLPQATAYDGPGNLPKNRPDLVFLALTGLRRAMAQCDVAYLVRHHAGKLSFVLCRFDQSAIDVSKTARQRERVDVARVDYLE